MRIDNSGIYLIASFDIENDIIYFSSFNNDKVYEYRNQTYSERATTFYLRTKTFFLILKPKFLS